MPAWERRNRRWKPKPYRARYAQAHRAKRKALSPVVSTGLAKCARCHEPILPGEPWDLGHVDGDGLRYAGPEHRRCNRATARHRKERELQLEEHRPRSREW